MKETGCIVLTIYFHFINKSEIFAIYPIVYFEQRNWDQ